MSAVVGPAASCSSFRLFSLAAVPLHSTATEVCAAGSSRRSLLLFSGDRSCLDDFCRRMGGAGRGWGRDEFGYDKMAWRWLFGFLSWGCLPFVFPCLLRSVTVPPVQTACRAHTFPARVTLI